MTMRKYSVRSLIIAAIGVLAIIFVQTTKKTISSFGSQENSCNLQFPPAADILLGEEPIAPGGKLSVSLRPKAELTSVIMKFSEQGDTLSLQSASNQLFAIERMKQDEPVNLQIPLPLELKRSPGILPRRNEASAKLEPKTYLLELEGNLPDGAPAYSADIIVFETLTSGLSKAVTLADYLEKHAEEQGALDILSASVIKNRNGVDSKAKLVQQLYDGVIDAKGNEQRIVRTEQLERITSIQSPVTVVVSGYIYFQDSNGNPHPLPDVEVAVWEDDGSSAFSSWDWRALTNSAGYYSITVTHDEPDNELELFIRLRTINTWLAVEHPVGSPEDGLAVWGDYPYIWTGPTVINVVAGSKILDYTINNSEKGAAQLFEWLMQGCYFTRSSFDPGAAQAVWPIGSGAGSYSNYYYNLKFGSIYANRNSHDVAYHEFGHLTMFRRNGYSPIGSGGSHYLEDLYLPGLAWSEGWATAYAQYINPDGYYDAANFPYRAPVEDNSLMAFYGYASNLADNTLHNEMRAAGALFDLYDYGEPAGWDDPANFIVSFPEMMTLIANNNFNSTIDFYNSLLSSGYLTNLEKSFASRVMINNTFNVPYVPPPQPLSVSISGPAEVYHPPHGQPAIQETWTANVSGGSSPFSYLWKKDGYGVGTASSSYVEYFSYNGTGGGTTQFTLRVDVTDAASQQAYSTKVVIEHNSGDWGAIANPSNGDAIRIPTKFEVAQNYPNPFNPETRISFGLPEPADVTITISDLLGREIISLASGRHSAGYQTVTWRGTDASRNKVGSGIYFYRITAVGETGKHFTKVMKMLLAK